MIKGRIKAEREYERQTGERVEIEINASEE